MKIFVETPEGKSDFTFKHMAILGRDPTCDIKIDDPLSSRKHCRIKVDGGKIYLEDLGSSNGTKVNDESVKKAIIKETDVIQIGKIKITVKLPPPKSVKLVKAGMVVVVESNGKKKKFTIKKDTVVLGREDTNDIVLNEKLSSRKHIQLTNEGDTIYLEDLGSSNGTRFNGAKISGKLSIPSSGVIEVGGTKITVETLSGESQPPKDEQPSVELLVTSPSKQETIRLIDTLVFGRDDVCDVVIFESSSSRRHFSITLKDGEVIVEDLNSSNGTKVNGERIKTHILKVDDILSVGDTKIQLKIENVKVKFFKVVIEHEMQFREYPFKDGILLGRGNECDIVLRDVKASRNHAKISFEENKYYIEDLDSTNGVTINQIKISKNEIPFGSYARIGKTKISIAEGEVDSHLGQLYNGYDILKRVSHDDNGTLYVAHQRSMRRTVTLNFVDAKFFEEEEKKKAFLEDTSRYSRIHNPHLVSIIESFTVNSHGNQSHVLATEYIEGLPLIKRIEKNGKIKVNNAVQFAIQACEGVESLHEKKLYHQNLMPSTFLITKGGIVKLSDAGMSKPELKSDYELSSEALRYEAPERGKGQSASISSDVYELGATLYHAVTGKPPFDGKTTLAVNTKKINILPEEPNKIIENIPSKLNDVIMKCLQINPESRYATMTALSQELQALNAAPVEWDLEDDYDSFETMQNQDISSLLWIVLGIFCVLGIMLNIFLYNSQSESSAKANAFQQLEKILKNAEVNADNVQDELGEFIKTTTSIEVKNKAKTILANMENRFRSDVPEDILNDYKKSLVLLNAGGESVQEAVELLKDLEGRTSENTQIGIKVRSKLFSVQAMLKK
ncbi:MAG: hypothetical protein COA79_23395 [Planctomycetota bacterium]|nr:MAG: hypothetical protein COA79_23395 [Planctomycetota bacterium]